MCIWLADLPVELLEKLKWEKSPLTGSTRLGLCSADIYSFPYAAAGLSPACSRCPWSYLRERSIVPLLLIIQVVSFFLVCVLLALHHIYRDRSRAHHTPNAFFPHFAFPTSSRVPAVRPMAHIVSCMLEADADDFTLNLNNYIAKAVTPQASNESVWFIPLFPFMQPLTLGPLTSPPFLPLNFFRGSKLVLER